jgi:hypothetical protein
LFVCLYVCMYGTYTYSHFWTDLNQILHTSPPWPGRDRRVCMDPNFLTSSTFWAFFLRGPQQNHGNKMAAGATVFCDTLISVIPAGVCVTSPTLRCRRWRSHPLQPYIRDSRGSSPNVAEMTVAYNSHSVISLIPVDVCVTSWILRSTGRQGHLPRRYTPHSSSCFCELQEITSLQTTVAHSYWKCVALSVMCMIRWDVNGIHVSTIRNLIRREVTKELQLYK